MFRKGAHPVNLFMRFLLEVMALLGLAAWGTQFGSGAVSWLVAVLLPLGAATAWGVFAVPEDPSRSGKAPVPVPGWLRLMIEALILGLGALGLYRAGFGSWTALFVAAVLLHYLFSLDRLEWLLQRS